MKVVHVYVKSNLIYKIMENGKERDIIIKGLTGFVQEGEWLGANRVKLHNHFFSPFEIDKTDLEAINGKEIVYDGYVFESKKSTSIIFEKIPFWSRVRFLFVSRLNVEATIYFIDNSTNRHTIKIDIFVVTYLNLFLDWIKKKLNKTK